MNHIHWPVTATCPDQYDYSTPPTAMDYYLKKTTLLNVTHSRLIDLVERRGWLNLPKGQQICEIFDYVKNEIFFGYNKVCNVPASRVLFDGYGCGNSKSILLMALLRICHIPCRFHVVKIDKSLHKNAFPTMAYYLVPRSIIYSWVDIFLDCKWLKLTGYTFDQPYLRGLGKFIKNVDDVFFEGTNAMFNNKPSAVTSLNTATYERIQGIHHDNRIFDSPDDFYQRHYADLYSVRGWLFKHLARNQTNNKLSHIRQNNGRKQGDLNVSRVDH